MTLARLALIFAALLAFGGGAAAHDKSVSYSEWSLRGGDALHSRITLTARQATLLLGDAQAPRDPSQAAKWVFEQKLAVTNAGENCPKTGPARLVAAATGSIAVEIGFRCPGPLGEDLAIRSDAFYDLSAGHLHFIRFRAKGSFREAALSADVRSFQPFRASGGDGEKRAEAGFADFLGSGVRHIVGGPDHLAFLLGVLLAAATARRAVLAVTGFTIGHSISLAAAVGGVVALEGWAVEALIALTIWLVGVEALIRFSPREALPLSWAATAVVIAAGALTTVLGEGSALFWLGAAVITAAYLRLAATQGAEQGRALLGATTLFGLVHGFGFAGALEQAFTDRVGLGLRLLAFNIGVEIGQLLFVAVIAAGAFLVARLWPAERSRAPASAAAALMLCALGAYWLAQRSAFAAV